MTQALVRVASPNPPSNTAAIAKATEALLAIIPGIEVRRVEPEPGIVSLVARLRGKGPGRRLIFNGHLDTFPIGEEAGWTVPPLSGDLREGRLYGRGVSDMKGGLGLLDPGGRASGRTCGSLGWGSRADARRR